MVIVSIEKKFVSLHVVPSVDVTYWILSTCPLPSSKVEMDHIMKYLPVLSCIIVGFILFSELLVILCGVDHVWPSVDLTLQISLLPVESDVYMIVYSPPESCMIDG